MVRCKYLMKLVSDIAYKIEDMFVDDDPAGYTYSNTDKVERLEKLKPAIESMYDEMGWTMMKTTVLNRVDGLQAVLKIKERESEDDFQVSYLKQNLQLIMAMHVIYATMEGSCE